MFAGFPPSSASRSCELMIKTPSVPVPSAVMRDEARLYLRRMARRWRNRFHVRGCVCEDAAVEVDEAAGAALVAGGVVVVDENRRHCELVGDRFVNEETTLRAGWESPLLNCRRDWRSTRVTGKVAVVVDLETEDWAMRGRRRVVRRQVDGVEIIVAGCIEFVLLKGKARSECEVKLDT